MVSKHRTMSSMKSERYPVTEEMEEAFVIDVDFHVEPSMETLLPYAETAVSNAALLKKSVLA